MRLFALLLVSLTSVPAAELDARQIIERAFAVDEDNERLARSYTFHERRERRWFGKQDNVKKTESKTWDVTLLEGSEYRRLIAEDDQPLNPKKEAQEQKKLDQSIARMQREKPKEREKRMRKIEKEREEDRRFIEEITRAYHFRLAGEEIIDGAPIFVIDAEPRADYKPAFRKAKILPKLRGRLWIAKEDYGWVKAEVDTIDSISFGWFLFRLKKGARMEFTQRYVNDEVWLVDNFRVRFRGKLGMLKGFNGEVASTFDSFRKFTTEAKIVAVEAVE